MLVALIDSDFLCGGYSPLLLCTLAYQVWMLKGFLFWPFTIINPQHMGENYSSHSVCVSVAMLAAAYHICKSKVRCYKVPSGVSNLCIVWISLKTLCSPLLAPFTYN